MKHTAILFLLFAASLPVGAQKNDYILANTKWKFVGLLYNTNGELHACGDNISYTINFHEKNEITGVATLSYHGKYKIRKNNEIRVSVFIPKGTYPGVHDSREFECRIFYSKYLGMGSTFSVEGDTLKIFSGKYVTMLFESIK